MNREKTNVFKKEIHCKFSRKSKNKRQRDAGDKGKRSNKGQIWMVEEICHSYIKVKVCASLPQNVSLCAIC